jgi:Fic family protein
VIFSAPARTDRETLVIQEVAKLHSSLSYTVQLSPRWTGLLRRNTSARNIRGSNSIEGYNVTIEDAVAAVQGEEPLDAKDENWLATRGYRDAMTYVLQKAEDPAFRYSSEILTSLHFMMIGYDLSRNPGRWRPGSVFVRSEATGEQVYEGAPSDRVVPLIDELVEGLNTPCSGMEEAIVRAAMAHLNLVMIHPFSDGNGRMGRCLQTLVLARTGVLASPFSSIEEYLGKNQQPYYEVLARVGQGSWHPENDARPWIRFCLTAHYRQAMTLLRRTRELQKLFDEIEILVERLGLPDRAILAVADAALGQRVRNPTYRASADISDAVAGNDLRALVRGGLLIPHGEKRGRFYAASPAILELRRSVAEPKSIADPFESALPATGTNQLPGE